MFFRKIAYSILAILFVLNIIFLGMIFHFQKSELQVAFLDVGQGDAILLTQGGNQVLIDGGKSEEKLLEGLGKWMPFWDRKIEIILATHPDQDHIGGLSKLSQKYEIGALISTKARSKSNVFKIFEENFSQKSIQKIEGKFGANIRFQEGLLEIIYPFSSLSEKVYQNTNSTSLVGKLTFGKDKFLLTGDMTKREEKKLIESKIDVKAQYLKVGHHGSKHSTSLEFLEKVKPKVAIISSGKNNRYGHPAEEVLKNLQKFNIEILRTDEEQDIVFVCKKDSSCQRKEL